MKLFSGSSNKALTENVAKELGIQVSPLEIHVFPDGEKRVQVVGQVIGEKTVVIQPTATPADSNYMELFFIVDALKRSGAEFVKVVVPYMGYQRQDHVFRDGEAVSLEVVIKTLERIGVDSIVSFDLHSIKIPEFFSIPVTHLSALPLFAKKIKEMELLSSDTILVTPDMGGIRRIKYLSELLENMPYAAIEKDRDLTTGVVTANTFGEGNVENKKRAIIVDDMIASGNTIVKAADVLLEHGIEEIYVFATHAIFSTDCPRLLQESVSIKIFVTDTVFIEEEKKFEKLEILSVAQMVAENIQ